MHADDNGNPLAPERSAYIDQFCLYAYSPNLRQFERFIRQISTCSVSTVGQQYTRTTNHGDRRTRNRRTTAGETFHRRSSRNRNKWRKHR